MTYRLAIAFHILIAAMWTVAYLETRHSIYAGFAVACGLLVICMAATE